MDFDDSGSLFHQIGIADFENRTPEAKFRFFVDIPKMALLWRKKHCWPGGLMNLILFTVATGREGTPLVIRDVEFDGVLHTSRR